ncbi:MAG TPA: hypothetical protein PLP17_02305 [Oligoflexia bacterium]|nr:hypothetical protein [Oligoflexia bacterium]
MNILLKPQAQQRLRTKTPAHKNKNTARPTKPKRSFLIHDERRCGS